MIYLFMLVLYLCCFLPAPGKKWHTINMSYSNVFEVTSGEIRFLCLTIMSLPWFLSSGGTENK